MLSMTPQQKIQLMRQAEISPGAAVLTVLEILRQEIENIISDKLFEARREKQSAITITNVVDEEKIIEKITPSVIRAVHSMTPAPMDGHTPSEEELIPLIQSLIPPVKDGHTPSAQEILGIVLPHMPDRESLMPTEEKMRELILSVMPEDDDSQDEEIAKKVEILAQEIELLKKLPRTVLKKGKYLHGGGPTITAGAGIVITTDSSGNITVSSSASGAFLAATGTIDDSNMVFGFASLPSLLNINGAFYQQTGGAITWTWNAGTLQATLSSPVGVNGSIFGLR